MSPSLRAIVGTVDLAFGVWIVTMGTVGVGCVVIALGAFCLGSAVEEAGR